MCMCVYCVQYVCVGTRACLYVCVHVSMFVRVHARVSVWVSVCVVLLAVTQMQSVSRGQASLQQGPLSLHGSRSTLAEQMSGSCASGFSQAYKTMSRQAVPVRPVLTTFSYKLPILHVPLSVCYLSRSINIRFQKAFLNDVT